MSSGDILSDTERTILVAILVVFVIFYLIFASYKRGLYKKITVYQNSNVIYKDSNVCFHISSQNRNLNTSVSIYTGFLCNTPKKYIFGKNIEVVSER